MDGKHIFWHFVPLSSFVCYAPFSALQPSLICGCKANLDVWWAVATLASLASAKARLFLVSFTILQFWCTHKAIILSIILSIASLYWIACSSWWRGWGEFKYFTGCFPRLPSESLLLSCLQWQQLNQLTKKSFSLGYFLFPLHFYPPLSLLSIFGWEPLIPMTLPLHSTPRPEAEKQQIVNETSLVLALDFYQRGNKQNLNKHWFSPV